jgi:hypothetical protein
MSGHDSKYFTTTKKGEIHELKEELNSQFKVRFAKTMTEARWNLVIGVVLAW